MSFFEGEFTGEEAGGVFEGDIGGGGIGGGSFGDVSYEFGAGSAGCRGGSGGDGQDSGVGAVSREKEIVSGCRAKT